MPRKTLPRRAKNFMRCPSLSREEDGRLRTFKNEEDAKRFYAAVQDEISRLTLYRLEEEARRYVHGEVRMRTQGKTIDIR
jgi:hypothetical protein